jgi:hypothetical protein
MFGWTAVLRSDADGLTPKYGDGLADVFRADGPGWSGLWKRSRSSNVTARRPADRRPLGCRATMTIYADVSLADKRKALVAQPPDRLASRQLPLRRRRARRQHFEMLPLRHVRDRISQSPWYLLVPPNWGTLWSERVLQHEAAPAFTPEIVIISLLARSLC